MWTIVLACTMHLNVTEDQCDYFSYSKHLYYKYIIASVCISHT
jgi:hypothetical protein